MQCSASAGSVHDCGQRRCLQASKDPSQLVFDHLHATAFQHSPLGRTVTGPVENVKAITKDHLLSYMKSHYRAPRMVSRAMRGIVLH